MRQLVEQDEADTERESGDQPGDRADVGEAGEEYPVCDDLAEQRT